MALGFKFLRRLKTTLNLATLLSSLPSTVNNTIIALGVLTFALQLCLVLFLMLRCWRFDNRVREALKHPEAVSKVTGEHLVCCSLFLCLF